MTYLIGYIANRVGVPSKAKQTAKLIECGVNKQDIYGNLGDALNSLRKGDEFVVYTVAILGRNKLNDTFFSVGEKQAIGVYSIKADRFYKCGTGAKCGIEVLSDAWEELNGVTKAQIAEVGRQKGGRKKSPEWSKAKEMKGLRDEGMSFKELAENYDPSESTIRRMINSYEEK